MRKKKNRYSDNKFIELTFYKLELLVISSTQASVDMP